MYSATTHACKCEGSQTDLHCFAFVTSNKHVAHVHRYQLVSTFVRHVCMHAFACALQHMNIYAAVCIYIHLSHGDTQIIAWVWLITTSAKPLPFLSYQHRAVYSLVSHSLNPSVWPYYSCLPHKPYSTVPLLPLLLLLLWNDLSLRLWGAHFFCYLLLNTFSLVSKMVPAVTNKMPPNKGK